MESTVTKLKSSLEGLDTRFELAEEKISELEYSLIEIIQTEE